jgi:integrase
MNYFKRTRKLSDGSMVESEEYYVRLRWKGKQVLKCTGYTTLADAKRYGLALRKALADGRTADLSEANLRRSPTEALVQDIVKAFKAAPGDWTPHTRRGYIGGLRTVIETALGTEPAWDSHALSILTSDLVFRFRHAVQVASTGSDDARRAQLARSANTALRSARALFSPHLLEHYRIHACLTLPNLTEFREAPGFRSVQKEDYRIPSDELVRSTLQNLEATRLSHPDRYAAIWLALGFGLRKSEAAAVKAGWFVRFNGRIHLELREVVQPGTPGKTSTATKSGAVAPRIPVSNGAWDHLGPIVELLPPDRHVLAPMGSATYRGDALFDEISEWLRELGWQTTKAFHEFRALAGCWVAMRDGLLVARDWLRHSSVTTTEQHYGRYVRTTVSDTAVDTAPRSVQDTPNPAGFGRSGGIEAGQTPVHVIDFSPVATATPSESNVVRP